jgi:glutamyl-tRNA reductase
MEPALMVIGLNHCTAQVAVRERFWMGESRRWEAVRQLSQAEGIEEMVVLATGHRTEFLLWASDPTLAVNSLLHFLSVEHGLKLSEWEHFYRLLDEAALTHIFRLASGLDSESLSESQITSEVKAAWEQACAAGACGGFLGAVLGKALEVAQRVTKETPISIPAGSIPTAVAELARQIFGSLQDRNVLLIGTGEVNERSANHLRQQGAGSVSVIGQTREQARELAQKLGGTAAAMEERWQHFLRADIVISCSSTPRVVLTRQDAERIASERNRTPLVIIDLAMPRNVDPDVRRVDGILLCDLDGLERVANRHANEHTAETAEAGKIVAAEAHAFSSKLQAESAVPTIVALRHRLDEICRQELEFFEQERGPFTREQDQALHAITNQVIQKIASSLARELKELPEKEEQDRMTAVVERLFHLKTPIPALAGTRSNKAPRGQEQEQAVANPH